MSFTAQTKAYKGQTPCALLPFANKTTWFPLVHHAPTHRTVAWLSPDLLPGLLICGSTPSMMQLSGMHQRLRALAGPGVLDLTALGMRRVPDIPQIVLGGACHLIILASPLRSSRHDY